MTPKTLAQAIPARFRQVAYSVIAALVGLELVWDVVPEGLESKVLGSLVVLGFGVSALNVSAD